MSDVRRIRGGEAGQAQDVLTALWSGFITLLSLCAFAAISFVVLLVRMVVAFAAFTLAFVTFIYVAWVFILLAMFVGSHNAIWLTRAGEAAVYGGILFVLLVVVQYGRQRFLGVESSYRPSPTLRLRLAPGADARF